jgi:hypothetical protein
VSEAGLMSKAGLMSEAGLMSMMGTVMTEGASMSGDGGRMKKQKNTCAGRHCKRARVSHASSGRNASAGATSKSGVTDGSFASTGSACPVQCSRDGCFLPALHLGICQVSLPPRQLRRAEGSRGPASSEDICPSDGCMICFEPCLVIDNVVAGRTACGHLYHLECLSSWVALRAECAVCRSPIAGGKRKFAPLAFSARSNQDWGDREM